MTRARAVGASILAAVLVALGVVCSGCAVTSSRAAGASSQSPAGAQFFRRYLSPDGRVVRADQGGDTVSEGQAYGLLLAVAGRDAVRFAQIWNWTRGHLQRPDGLLAFHWADGRVVDRNPAPDADLDAATALLQAARLFGIAAYRTVGIAIANSVLTYESVTASPGSLIAAGTWAVADPTTINPSYVVAGEARYLAHETGNPQWAAVATATGAYDRSLAARSVLPPDWTRLASGAPAQDATAVGSPDGSGTAQYGLDAPRLIIRLASSCLASDRGLAAAYAKRLGGSGAAGERTLAGSPLVTWRHPLTDVALYAARVVAGDRSGAASALSAATAQDHRHPTYYGAAWLALAPELFASLKETC